MPKGDDKPKVKIQDGRVISAVTGQPLKLNRSGEYSPDVIRHIALAATRMGNDPYTALAIGMQESGLGTDKNFNAQNNYGQVDYNRWGKDQGLISAIKANPDLNPQAVAMSYVLKNTRDKYSKEDELHQIQGYNGFRLHAKNDIGSKVMYGLDISKQPGQVLDLYKNPLYAKSVLDLRENVLKKNPSVVQMIEALKNPSPNPATAGITIAAANGANGQKQLSFMKDGKVFKEVTVNGKDFDDLEKRKTLLRTALDQ